LLKVEPELIKSIVSLKTISGVLQDDGEGYILEWKQILDIIEESTKVVE